MQRPYLVSRIVLGSFVTVTATWPVVAMDDIQPVKQSAANSAGSRVSTVERLLSTKAAILTEESRDN